MEDSEYPLISTGCIRIAESISESVRAATATSVAFFQSASVNSFR